MYDNDARPRARSEVRQVLFPRDNDPTEEAWEDDWFDEFPC